MSWQNHQHMTPLRTNLLRTSGYPRSKFEVIPPIALKNPRVGWKILNRFLSNGSAAIEASDHHYFGSTPLRNKPWKTSSMMLKRLISP